MDFKSAEDWVELDRSLANGTTRVEIGIYATQFANQLCANRSSVHAQLKLEKLPYLDTFINLYADQQQQQENERMLEKLPFKAMINCGGVQIKEGQVLVAPFVARYVSDAGVPEILKVLNATTLDRLVGNAANLFCSLELAHKLVLLDGFSSGKGTGMNPFLEYCLANLAENCDPERITRGLVSRSFEGVTDECKMFDSRWRFLLDNRISLWQERVQHVDVREMLPVSEYIPCHEEICNSKDEFEMYNLAAFDLRGLEISFIERRVSNCCLAYTIMSEFIAKDIEHESGLLDFDAVYRFVIRNLTEKIRGTCWWSQETWSKISQYHFLIELSFSLTNGESALLPEDDHILDIYAPLCTFFTLRDAFVHANRKPLDDFIRFMSRKSSLNPKIVELMRNLLDFLKFLQENSRVLERSVKSLYQFYAEVLSWNAVVFYEIVIQSKVDPGRGLEGFKCLTYIFRMWQRFCVQVQKNQMDTLIQLIERDEMFLRDISNSLFHKLKYQAIQICSNPLIALEMSLCDKLPQSMDEDIDHALEDFKRKYGKEISWVYSASNEKIFSAIENDLYEVDFIDKWIDILIGSKEQLKNAFLLHFDRFLYPSEIQVLKMVVQHSMKVDQKILDSETSLDEVLFEVYKSLAIDFQPEFLSVSENVCLRIFNKMQFSDVLIAFDFISQLFPNCLYNYAVELIMRESINEASIHLFEIAQRVLQSRNVSHLNQLAFKLYNSAPKKEDESLLSCFYNAWIHGIIQELPSQNMVTLAEKDCFEKFASLSLLFPSKANQRAKIANVKDWIKMNQKHLQRLDTYSSIVNSVFLAIDICEPFEVLSDVAQYNCIEVCKSCLPWSMSVIKARAESREGCSDSKKMNIIEKIVSFLELFCSLPESCMWIENLKNGNRLNLKESKKMAYSPLLISVMLDNNFALTSVIGIQQLIKIKMIEDASFIDQFVTDFLNQLDRYDFNYSFAFCKYLDVLVSAIFHISGSKTSAYMDRLFTHCMNAFESAFQERNSNNSMENIISTLAMISVTRDRCNLLIECLIKNRSFWTETKIREILNTIQVVCPQELTEFEFALLVKN